MLHLPPTASHLLPSARICSRNAASVNLTVSRMPVLALPHIVVILSETIFPSEARNIAQSKDPYKVAIKAAVSSRFFERLRVKGTLFSDKSFRQSHNDSSTSQFIRKRMNCCAENDRETGNP